MNRFARSSSAIYLRGLVVVIAGLMVYANSLTSPFVFDDEASIVQNQAIRSLGTVIRERLNSPIAGRPVVGMSLAVNFALGGLNVRGYHVANLAIHLCAALLLFGIVRRTLALPTVTVTDGDRALNVGFTVALLWVVHPLNTDAVTYITQRTESLMAVFYLLTVYGALRGFTTSVVGWHVLAVAACAAGMACKESMVTAPLVVLLYDRIFLFGTLKDAIRTRWRLYVGLASTWLVLAYLMWPGPRANTVGVRSVGESWTYVVNQAAIVARYLRLAFWPSGLVVDYGPLIPLTLGDVWPQALLIMSLLLLTLAALRWKPGVGFLGACVFVLLAPTSSVVPILTEVGAERRMYLPLMAIIALATVGVTSSRRVGLRIPRTGWMFAVAASTIALGALTIVRNRDYESGLRLAQSVAQHRPSAAAHGLVGSELARLGRNEEAIPELRVGARVEPQARYDLGVALFNEHRFDEAIAELQGLATEYPLREETPLARRIAGRAFGLEQKWPEAVAELQLALAMTPGDVEARGLLVDALNQQGLALAEAGQFRGAVTLFRRATALDPVHVGVRQNLATALLDSDDLAAAEKEAAAAIVIDPRDAGLYELLGRALALQRKTPEAIAQFEHALRLAPGDEHIKDDLRRVIAESR